MEKLPKDAIKIQIEQSTVDFYKFKRDEITYYYFDTSLCGPPEPMINAMAGLQLLDNDSKLIMINHKIPIGLFPKIQNNFTYEIEEIKNEKHKIIFSYITNSENKTDFSQNTCTG